MKETPQGLQMKYFVLNPNKKNAYGKASRMAVCAYANSIKLTNRKLSNQLTFWIIGIQAKLAGVKP